MKDPKKLYEYLIGAYRADEGRYSLCERGEGMYSFSEKSGNRSCLLNTNTKEAWELVGDYGKFVEWDPSSSVDKNSISDMPVEVQVRAENGHVSYAFGVNYFTNGVASVSWTLQPDGQYYADEDGFGGTRDREITLTAFIDSKARILVPFQLMDRETESHLKRLAIEIANK